MHKQYSNTKCPTDTTPRKTTDRQMIAIEDPQAIQVVLVGNKVPRQECDNKWITERKKATRNQKKKVVIEMENITQNKFAELESQGDKQVHKGMDTYKGERSHTKPQNEQIQDEWADNTSAEDEESINESSEDEDEILNYHNRGKDDEAEDVQKAVKEIHAMQKAYLQEKIENMSKGEEPGKNLLVGAQRVKENYHKRPLIFLLMIKILNWNIRELLKDWYILSKLIKYPLLLYKNLFYKILQ
ncbi:hypothetical protein P3S67_012760 [Capsicum chacoense]